jgi:carbon-monoxide dehydrogenase medium subunit
MLAEHAGEARVVAGGQSLVPMLNLRLARPSTLIDISGLCDLKRIDVSHTTVSLGSTVTHAELEFSKHVGATFDILRYVAHGIAYRAVRNRGTIGGSIAHADPAADWLSCLLAMDAKVVLSGTDSTRALGLSDFVLSAFTTALKPDEFVVRIDIPVLGPNTRWGYYKHNRKVGEFAEAIGCVVRDDDQRMLRVVAGAFAFPPVLLFDTPRRPLPDYAEIRAAITGRADDEVSCHFHAAAVVRAIERSAP